MFNFSHHISNWKEIIIPNEDILNDKIRTIRTETLAIVTDFDRTLTTHFVDGTECPSLIGTLRRAGVLSDDYTFAAYCLHDYFYPIEIDTTRTRQDKSNEMAKWWGAHLSLLSGNMSYAGLTEIVGADTITKRLNTIKNNYNEEWINYWNTRMQGSEKIAVKLSKSIISNAINSGFIQMREDIGGILDITNSANIPLLIFSANGLGSDSIESYLQNHKLTRPNLHIVSNQFQWNDDGMAIGYKEPLIHIFNKDISGIKAYPDIYRYIEPKKHIVLIGDSIGDAHMTDGHNPDVLLRIGLITKAEQTKQDKKAYSEVFDIVLIGDGDLRFLSEFLKYLTYVNH